MAYQPNESGVMTDGMPVSKLASPWIRLVAFIIDSIPVLVGFIISFGGVAYNFDVLVLVGSALSSVVYIAIAIVQVVLMATRGQTIGKMIVKIRIVDAETGEHPGGWRIIMLRVIAHIILISTIIYWPIDTLFVFRKDRRTIHDLIAQTRVDKIAG